MRNEALERKPNRRQDSPLGISNVPTACQTLVFMRTDSDCSYQNKMYIKVDNTIVYDFYAV